MIVATGVLFDIDGTLVQSLAAVERAWVRFAERHQLERDGIYQKIHGRRSIDSIRLLLPHLDAEEEDLILRGFEAGDTEGVHPTAGVLGIIENLAGIPWGVVTSGTSDVATARLRAAGISGYQIAVFGEDVVRGKPDPEPFLLGARRLGKGPVDCVAFEDTAAGVQSAKAAGMSVIGIGHADQLAEADEVAPDFTHLGVVVNGASVEVWVRE